MVLDYVLRIRKILIQILFAPIMEKGQVERKVYLPEGIWISIIDKERYTGKQWITAPAEINEYIAFVKAEDEVRAIFNLEY